MHTAALVGRTAEVLSEVTDSDGRVKLGGEIWSARTLPAGRTLEVGSLVRVIRIDGATAVVDAATLSIEE
jgi:membrane protein implicated in regulation of membrane protease activity